MYYSVVSREIERLGGKSVGKVCSPGSVYDFYMLSRGSGEKVLLSGAVHGDEPAGLYSILNFFDGPIKEFENDFEFTAFPCVNPWGLDNRVRNNSKGLNINRSFFEGSGCREFEIINGLLEDYVFSVDLHEVIPGRVLNNVNEPPVPNPNGFYLWENCVNKGLRVGDKIVKNVEGLGFPVCKDSFIYGDKNSGGVIWYPEGCGTDLFSAGPFDSYLISSCRTSQAFTIETPTIWLLEERVKAHVLSIETILEQKI